MVPLVVPLVVPLSSVRKPLLKRLRTLLNNPLTRALLRMTADIVSAYVSKNVLPAQQIPDVINTVYSSLTGLNGQPREVAAEPLKPAVPIRKSVTPEYIVCLEDGKKLKMLKRHLRSTYNMSPDEVYAIGQKEVKQQLVEMVTGSKISPEPYVRYLTKKYSEIYGL